MRSISSTDLDSTDPVSTPSPKKQATASPNRKHGILALSGVAIIAIAASGAYAFTTHSTASAVIESVKQVLDQANTYTNKLNAALAPSQVSSTS